MSQVSPLDRVIRRVEAGYTPHDNHQKVVIVDARDRVVVPKKRFFGSAHLRHYLVQTSGDSFNAGKGEINGFQLQDLADTLPVSLKYDVRCRAGSEERAALALFDDAAAPAEILERLLLRWLMDAARTGIPSFVRTWVDEPETLESQLSARALTDAGLDLNVRITLDYARTLNPVVISREHVRTLVSDYHDEEQNLSFRITLELDDARRAEAILQYRRNQQLQEIVPREIARFMREQVTMQQFCTELNSASMRARLAAHLDRAVAPFGRKTAAVKLDAPPSGLEFFSQRQHDVKCDLPPYPRQVVIANEVQMILTDVALFKAARSLNLDEWLRERLERIIRGRLFGAKYIEVLLDFTPFEADIKQQLSDAAAAIGYEIKQLITVPDLEPIHLKEPFTIEAGGKFDLRLPNFQVELLVIVNTRIPDLHVVKDQLNRLQHVPDLMRDAVLAEARQVLHAIEPERFYMRFGYTEREGENAVEAELIEKMVARLTKGFGADVIEVIVKVADNDVIKRLRDLQKEISDFAVTVIPLDKGEPVTLRGNFQIDMVDSQGWSRFEQLQFDLPTIAKKLQDHLFAKLQALPPEVIRFRDSFHQKQLEQAVTGLAERYVCTEFGLRVRVSNVCRDRTAGEEHLNQALLAGTAAKITEQEEYIQTWLNTGRATRAEQEARLKHLLALRTELATVGSPDELEGLDREIAEIRQKVEPRGLPELTEVERALLPPPARQVSLEDFGMLEGIAIQPHAQRQLTEGEKE